MCSRKPAIESDLARDAFSSLVVDPPVAVVGHTHAQAAGLRTAATAFVMNMAQYTGASVFIMGMSRSDQRKNYRGTRQWFWCKDANAENRSDDQRHDDIQYLCDVDYYVDMPDLLSREAKPVVLYTMVPETAAQTAVDNTSYRFMEDGSLQTTVAGGGVYHHHLWNYGMDSVLVTRRFLGIPWKSIAYSIERKQVGPNRHLVLLAPMKEFVGIGSWLAVTLMETATLSRFNPVVQTDDVPFIRFNITQPNGQTLVTTSVAGSFSSATVPAAVDETIASVARLSSTNLMMPTTASWIKDDKAAAVILTRFHRATVQRSQLTVFPVAKAVRAYQYAPANYDQEARPKLQAFMSPFVHEAFAPVANKAGEEQCVEGRINSLRKSEPKPCKFRDRCIDEFAELVVQGAVLEPVCYEHVASKQTSAAQKLSLAKATVMGWFRARILKCFIKAEAYAKISDPRNISTYNDGDKLDMAQFSLALAAHCKKFPWYGPGKNPLQIAERTAEICSNAQSVNISDYHRMDGTITYVLRQVDRAVCMKAFAHHRAKLNELLKTNVDNTGYLPCGTTFNQGPSHGSGCSATSLFQTLRASFTAYLAFRNQRSTTGGYLSPEEAFASIGIHLGDDGIDADLSITSHQWAADRVGLVLEASVVQRGFRGVNFLARYYSPNVWFGDLNSMCDVKRQLSKFHTTVRLPENVKPEQKLVEKAMSYVATDGNTPVLGNYCKRVLLLSSFKPKSLLGVGNWWSRFDESVQYPNRNDEGWMDVEYDALFAEFDRSQFNEWLASADTVEKLLQPPLCAEPRAAQRAGAAVVVDGDVLPAEEENVTKTPLAPEEGEAGTPAQPPKRRRRRRNRTPTANVEPRGESRIIMFGTVPAPIP
jgi:hypothetical protein